MKFKADILLTSAAMGVVSVLFWIACRAEVNSYDSYVFMAMAKYFAGFQYWFPPEVTTRPPLLPFLMSPIALLHHLGLSNRFVFVLMNLFSFALWVGLILACHNLFKKVLERSFAWLATFLILLNPGMLTYTSESLTDIPAALVMTLIIITYLHYRKTGDHFIIFWLCLLSALAINLRYNLILAPLVLWVTEIFILITRRQAPWPQILRHRFIYLLPLLTGVLHILTSFLCFYPKYGMSLKNLQMSYMPFFLHTFQNAELAKELFIQGKLTYFMFLEDQMTLPLFLLMIFGFFTCLYKRKSVHMIFVWLLLIFLPIMILGHNQYEYRYLFPILPACYFFSIYGLQNLTADISRITKIPVASTILKPLCFGLVLVLPFKAFAVELNSLSGDFYKNPMQRNAAQYSLEISNPHSRIFWIGPFFTMHPAGNNFIPTDPFYKIYHYAPHSVSFFADKKITQLDYDKFSSPSLNIFEGDVVIWNRFRKSLVSFSLLPPKDIPPLIISRVSKTELSLSEVIEGIKNFSSETKPALNVKLGIEDGHAVMTGRGPFPAGSRFLVSLRSKPQDHHRDGPPFKILAVEFDGPFSVTMNRYIYDHTIGVSFLFFKGKEFHYLGTD